MDYAPLRRAYRDAFPRFIRDTVIEDEITWARMRDPELGLTMRMDLNNAKLLPQLFRSRWIQLARERRLVHA